MLFFSDDFCLSNKKLVRLGCCRQIGKLWIEFSNPEGPGPKFIHANLDDASSPIMNICV